MHVMYYAKISPDTKIQNVHFHLVSTSKKTALHHFHLLISKNASTKSLNKTIHSLHSTQSIRLVVHTCTSTATTIMPFAFRKHCYFVWIFISMENFNAKLINLLRAFSRPTEMLMVFPPIYTCFFFLYSTSMQRRSTPASAALKPANIT